MIPMEMTEDNMPDFIGADINAGENISGAVVSREVFIRSQLGCNPGIHYHGFIFLFETPYIIVSLYDPFPLLEPHQKGTGAFKRPGIF